jgi:sulfite exporter TauE/SafE
MTPSCHPLAETGNPSLDLPLLFLTGLTVSLGHCVGMCGPIQTAFSLEQSRRGAGPRRLLPGLLLYHGGRVLAYVSIGAAFALVGSVTRFGDTTRTLQGGLSLAAGLLMLGVALGVMGLAPVRGWAEPDWGGGFVTRRMQGLLAGSGRLQRGGLGFLNGLLPCGPVYAVALGAAAAAHVLVGMLLLGVYGLGTVPVLVVLGLVSGRLSPRIRQGFTRVGGVFLLVLALQLGLRGAATLGWLPHLHLGRFVIW